MSKGKIIINLQSLIRAVYVIETENKERKIEQEITEIMKRVLGVAKSSGNTIEDNKQAAATLIKNITDKLNDAVIAADKLGLVVEFDGPSRNQNKYAINVEITDPRKY